MILFLAFLLWTACCAFAMIAAFPGTTAPTPQLDRIRLIIKCLWLVGTAALVYVEMSNQ